MSEQYHFFATSAVNWTTDANLAECLRRQLAADRDAQRSLYGARAVYVYKVLLPAEAKYKITVNGPVLPDDQVIFIDRIGYAKTKSGRLRFETAADLKRK